MKSTTCGLTTPHFEYVYNTNERTRDGIVDLTTPTAVKHFINKGLFKKYGNISLPHISHIGISLESFSALVVMH